MKNKPNEWISIADLMTGVVGVAVLFFVMMAMLANKIQSDGSQKDRSATQREQQETDRQHEIDHLMENMARAAAGQEGIHVDTDHAVIDFGDRARFESGSYRLTPEQEQLLRSFVPQVLAVARGANGTKWLKRVVIVGFADGEGKYLANLNLSLQRSQRVLCALLRPSAPGEAPMGIGDQDNVRRLFLVGGYSSNSAKETWKASRRIEFRLEFYAFNEQKTGYAPTDADPGPCAI